MEHKTDLNSSFDSNLTSKTNASLLGGDSAAHNRPRAFDLTRHLEMTETVDSVEKRELEPPGFTFFDKRAADAVQCGPGQPCADGSCCNNR